MLSVSPVGQQMAGIVIIYVVCGAEHMSIIDMNDDQLWSTLSYTTHEHVPAILTPPQTDTASSEHLLPHFMLPKYLSK